MLKEQIDSIGDFDVLVVGGGGAGAMAALSAAESGASVLLADKGVFARSGATPMAYFSACAALGHESPGDSFEAHFEDTMRSGQSLCDRELTLRFVQEAPRRILQLRQMGVRFEQRDGRLRQAKMPGHRFPRACFVDHRTGLAIMSTLRRHVLENPCIRVLNDTYVIRLLQDEEGGIAGALMLSLLDSKWYVVRTPSIVLATGGGGQLYRVTTMARENTADGIHLAYSAGAELIDLEFVQFFPLTLLHPRLPGVHPCFPSLLRRGGRVILLGKDGRTLIDYGDPTWRERATRDELSFWIDEEIRRGNGGEHGGVWMHAGGMIAPLIEENRHVAEVYAEMAKSGFDLATEPIEVGPSAHFFMGGIRIDPSCRTTVRGLYACGEASAGIHGANRLGGNALTEMLVTGAAAGSSAFHDRRSGRIPDFWSDETGLIGTIGLVRGWREKGRGIRPKELKKKVQSVMTEMVGVSREGQKLRLAIRELDDLELSMKERMAISSRDFKYNKELIEGIEVSMMTTAARLVARAALFREESRGAHQRTDFPGRNDDRWLCHGIIRKRGEECSRPDILADRPSV